MRDSRHVVALGGGGFSMEAGNPLLDDYVLSLAAAERPKVCFLPAASGDADHYIVRFYRTFGAQRCEPSHVSLFRRDHKDVDFERHLLGQDVIYVGGGSVLSLLGVLRAHGLDRVLRDAWEAGVVLCGVSAGSLCWFHSGITAFHGPPQPYEGLGLLPFSNTVHYDAERCRDSEYRRQLRAGMPAGYAAEDGAALHFVGERLDRVVTSRPEARAFRMRRTSAGRVARKALPARFLGAPDIADQPAAAAPAVTAAPEPLAAASG